MTIQTASRNTHRQLATNSKTTAKTRAVKIATSSRIIASQVAETLIDSAENNRDCFSGWNLREPALRIPHTILHTLGVQIRVRLGFHPVKVINCTASCILFRNQLLGSHIRRRRWSLTIQVKYLS